MVDVVVLEGWELGDAEPLVIKLLDTELVSDTVVVAELLSFVEVCCNAVSIGLLSVIEGAGKLLASAQVCVNAVYGRLLVGTEFDMSLASVEDCCEVFEGPLLIALGEKGT